MKGKVWAISMQAFDEGLHKPMAGGTSRVTSQKAISRGGALDGNKRVLSWSISAVMESYIERSTIEAIHQGRTGNMHGGKTC
jgi:hypothetical protein